MQKGIQDNNTAEITVITDFCQEKKINELVEELKDFEINSIIRVAV